MELIRIKNNDAEELWKMQVAAFAELLERYQDHDTNPANETLERVKIRLDQPSTYYYFIINDGVKVGAIRVVDMHDGSRKRISPLFIMKEYRGKGLAQAAIRAVEEIHGGSHWQLDTILQEAGNCHLYEKMGYRRTGKTEVINERMTIIDYEKA
ncbi:MAG: GNAT family N-acetyltransferase [Ruminococcus sp.]|nr:GNAT family N-acetyltransferase [Ruminococcus sp.]MCR4861499.1 GNAT family N-acetyltransferase [Ruminococcus sp.]